MIEKYKTNWYLWENIKQFGMSVITSQRKKVY